MKIYSLDDVRAGDCIIWKGMDNLAKIIEWQSDGFSHASCAMVFPQYPFELWVFEEVAGGLLLNYFPTVRKQHGTPFLLPLLPKYDEYRDAIVLWMLHYLGVPYNYWGVSKNLFGHIAPDISRMFCSEAIQLSLYDTGLIPEPKVASRPGELIKYSNVLGELGELSI
jgi:hypothetical protein